MALTKEELDAEVNEIVQTWKDECFERMILVRFPGADHDTACGLCRDTRQWVSFNRDRKRIPVSPSCGIQDIGAMFALEPIDPTEWPGDDSPFAEVSP